MGSPCWERVGGARSVRAARCENPAKTLWAHAVADAWLGDRDEPGSWEASYAPALITGDHVIAKGETRYTNGNVFSNLFEL
ncbi:MAG TPA: hypothetical protein VKB28_02435 [Solirubrobacteraceae bacterium]|nr:hypothetical protein [Solirubrobacteraceae bacterium]